MKLQILGCFLILAFYVGCGSIPTSATHAPERGASKGANPKEIVFIHGMFMTPKSFEAWTKYFESRGYKVSAPAWPLHDLSLETQRSADSLPALAKLEFKDVLEKYRTLLRGKNSRPIVVGHSMGGLIAQLLLAEGLTPAAIAIDSAPPKGVISLKFSFLRSNWGIIRPFADDDQALTLDQAGFSYRFANAQSEETQKKLYEAYYVPESRRVGKGANTELTRIDPTRTRGPLLLIAGEQDHIIPASLSRSIYKSYDETPAYTEFREFAGRDHSLLMSDGWEEIAGFVHQWIEQRF